MKDLNNEIELLRMLKMEIYELRKCFDLLEDESVRENVKKIIVVSEKIYKEAANDSDKLHRVRNFIKFYLNTVLKVVDRYSKFKEYKLKDREVQELYFKIENFLPKAYESFEKIFNSLFTNEILDIDSEIKIILKEMGI